MLGKFLPCSIRPSHTLVCMFVDACGGRAPLEMIGRQSTFAVFQKAPEVLPYLCCSSSSCVFLHKRKKERKKTIAQHCLLSAGMVCSPEASSGVSNTPCTVPEPFQPLHRMLQSVQFSSSSSWCGQRFAISPNTAPLPTGVDDCVALKAIEMELIQVLGLDLHKVLQTLNSRSKWVAGRHFDRVGDLAAIPFLSRVHDFRLQWGAP